jgi:hypothetical protein
VSDDKIKPNIPALLTSIRENIKNDIAKFLRTSLTSKFTNTINTLAMTGSLSYNPDEGDWANSLNGV